MTKFERRSSNIAPMKKLLALGAVATLFLGAASAQAAKVTYIAEDMTGAKVNPPNASTATADFEMTIDTDTMKYCARTKVTPATLVSTGILLYQDNSGAAVPTDDTVFQIISGEDATDTIWNSGDLTAQQLIDLGANDYYVQLTTEAFADGELRDALSLLDDDQDPGVTCPTNDGDAGADAGDAGDAGADAATEDAGDVDAGTDSDAGADGDDSGTGITQPTSDAGASSSSSSSGGDGTADSTSDSCTTSAPGGAPVGMAFALVGGLGIVAAFRRRRRSR